MSIKESLARGLLFCISKLPLPINRGLGCAIGWLWYQLPTRERHICRRNIAHCYPELTPPAQRQLVKNSLMHSGINLVEIPLIWQCSLEWLNKKVLKVEGIEHLHALNKHPNGGIVIGPHLGNWEVVGNYITQIVGGTITLYRPPKQKALEPLLLKGRTRYGNTILPASMRGVSGLLKHLRTGGTTCILPDQVPTNTTSGVYAPFFKQPALTMTLINNFIQKTDCASVFVVAKRVPGGFHLHCLPTASDIGSSDPVVAASALNQGIEQCIEHCPEQYQWAYKRFKRLPDGGHIYKR